MRQRTLKPGFFTNEDLCALPPLTRLLFQGLWLISDREGRFENRPARIKVTLFPYETDLDIASMLRALESNGFIRLYTVGGKAYGMVTTFKRNQNPHPKEIASVIPAPVELHGEQVASNLKQHASNAGSSFPSGPSFPSGSSGSTDTLRGLSIHDSCNRLTEGNPDIPAIDRLDEDIAFEESRFNSLALSIGRDRIQSVLDSLPRPKSVGAFSASRWLATGRSGIGRDERAMTRLKLTNDGLEAWKREVESPSGRKKGPAPAWDRGIDHDVPDEVILAWDPRLGPKPDAIRDPAQTRQPKEIPS